MKKYNEYINEGFLDRLNIWSFKSIKHKFKINTKEIQISRYGLYDFRKNLRNLNGIEDFKKLEYLECYVNDIIDLEPLKNLINMRNISCSENKIVSLEPLKNLTNLDFLSCDYNMITSLEPLENLMNLTKLFCNDNQLQSFKGLPENVQVMGNHRNPLNNWEEDVDSFIRAYKISWIESKKWLDKQKRFDEIIDLIKINII